MIQNLFAADAGAEVSVASAVQDKPAAQTPAKAEPAVAAANQSAPETTPEKAPATATPAKAAPAKAVPASAETPTTAVAAISAKADARKDSSAEIASTVTSWAKAWSSQDAKLYLSLYANDFKTPDGETRAAWEAIRRERISAPKFINVGIRISTISFTDSQHATVKFHQSYRASNYKASGNKSLLMVNTGGKWLIQEERSR